MKEAVILFSPILLLQNSRALSLRHSFFFFFVLFFLPFLLFFGRTMLCLLSFRRPFYIPSVARRTRGAIERGVKGVRVHENWGQGAKLGKRVRGQVAKTPRYTVLFIGPFFSTSVVLLSGSGETDRKGFAEMGYDRYYFSALIKVQRIVPYDVYYTSGFLEQ